LRNSLEVVSLVLKFRVNEYVLDELIDWSRIPDDPIYRMTFPCAAMLAGDAYARLASLLARGSVGQDLEAEVARIRLDLNPHTGGQVTDNVPELDGRRLAGLQHKYRESVLFFPAAGQTCHAYCSYCFRWPQRFVVDDDADDLLRVFERVVASGRHLALMAHYSHPAELEPEIARRAATRIRSTGAEIRMQAPLVRGVDDRPDTWVDLWNTGVRLGMVLYYTFVLRATGPRRYFEVPLAKAYEIFRDAYSRVSGVARTVRGPSMSAHPGKVRVLGTATISGRRCSVLDFLQSRDPRWVRRPFHAHFSSSASWFDDLEPAFEEQPFPSCRDSPAYDDFSQASAM
jgi:L-lysine 2,3-aminomutase